MAISGLWSLEIFGLYGWESIGVVLLNDGYAVGGGNHHYAVGLVEENRTKVDITLTFHYFAKPRTLFGETRREFTVKFVGKKAGKNDRYVGHMFRPEKAGMSVTSRMKRRADLPVMGCG